MPRFLVALAIVALLAGCSSPPAVKVDPSVAREAAFLTAVDSVRAETPDKDLLTAGYGVCKALENGTIQKYEALTYAVTTYAKDLGPGVSVAGMRAELLCPNWQKPSS